jgi:uncharacterized protein YdeI (YjbR/CyaY-like superfamily)
MMRHTSVPEYIAASEWAAELELLRGLVLSTGLEETLKWGAPCYTHGGRNVVGLAGFKAYFGLWFHDGVDLSDPRGVLVNAQAGKTKRLRQWRFTSAQEVPKRDVKAYCREALALAQEAGPKHPAPQRPTTVRVPAELKAALAAAPQAAAAFKGLTPGKRREYAEYIAEAKQAATKLRRIGKILPMIEAGVGLNDRYR